MARILRWAVVIGALGLVLTALLTSPDDRGTPTFIKRSIPSNPILHLADFDGTAVVHHGLEMAPGTRSRDLPNAWMHTTRERMAMIKEMHDLEAKPNSAKRHIFLESALLDTSTEPEAHTESESPWGRTADTSSLHLYLVAYSKGSGMTRESLIECIGVEPKGFFPQASWIVRMSPAAALAARDCQGVVWVGAFKPEYKIDRLLHSSYAYARIAREAAAHGGPSGVDDPVARRARDFAQAHSTPTLTVVPADAEIPLAAVLADAHPDLSFTTRDDRVVLVTGVETADLLPLANSLAELPSVRHIGLLAQHKIVNAWSHEVYQASFDDSPKPGRRPIHEAGLDGKGQIIAIGDTGINQAHCSFSGDKVKTYDNALGDATDGPNGHGTHVAGSAAGNNPDDDTFNGAAPEALIHFTDTSITEAPGQEPALTIRPLGGLDETGYYFKQHEDGARLSSNSWGAGNPDFSPRGYTIDSQGSDLWVDAHPDFLPIFAAGNDGEAGSQTILTPGNSKNDLTIGAGMAMYESWAYSCSGGICVGNLPENVLEDNKSDFDYSSMAGFSSRGPAFDGRIDPQITCPGYWIASADVNSTCDFAFSAGTSMAAPTCAGGAALVRQYFEDGYYPTGKPVAANSMKPTSATVKAVMINSAVKQAKIGGAQLPNGYHEFHGYGRLSLSETLFFSKDKTQWSTLVVQDESVSEGEEFKTCFQVASNKRLAVTLTWVDPPGEVNTAKALVNDLDLKLTGPGSPGEYNGNTEGVFIDAEKNPNPVDNTEKIELPEPIAGRYCAHVIGSSLDSSSQKFSLVVTGGGIFFNNDLLYFGLLGGVGVLLVAGAGIFYAKSKKAQNDPFAGGASKGEPMEAAAGLAGLDSKPFISDSFTQASSVGNDMYTQASGATRSRGGSAGKRSRGSRGRGSSSGKRSRARTSGGGGGRRRSRNNRGQRAHTTY